MEQSKGVALDVRLLGQIEAADGQLFALGGPTQRRVLAALSLRRNEVVSIPHLVEVIWAEGEPPVRAEHNVRTYVHRLRSSLGGHGERIETVGSGYRLRLDDDELDVARFEQLAGTAKRRADTGDAVAALDLINEAERLWRGAPIEEFENETWAMPDAVRIRELYSGMQARRAELLLELGRPGESAALLEVLVRAEPLREQPRALLMRALYESGRQADSLRAFQEFRKTLIDEVGIEPSPDLAELDRSIATGRLASTEPARTVGGYVLHERIGEGAFAIVHRATQESLGREVAVKIIRAELANRPEFIRRFEAEAQMVARIEHPNLVPLYDYWREPDRAYLVMRWMTGGSLHTRLEEGSWPLEPVIELVDQLAGVLDAAHRQGVVHRDVKPDNILFDHEGRAYLADFGIALEEADRARPEAALSEGSPIFASPEQLRREPVGPEADIHALAIVTYTLLVGRPPFADTVDEPTRLQRHLHEPIPEVRTVRPELPERIDQVLGIAAAKQPTDRYPTATAFALALRAATDSVPAITTNTASVRSHVNPYKGLRAFDETDTADFYGRERLIDELIEHLNNPDNRLLALVGPSGSGKSSVVRAGLIPALRRDRIPGSSDWFTTTMIPGTQPYEALEIALLRVAVNPPSALVEQLANGDRGILRAVRRVLPDDHTQIVVVIDQFEELFTASVTDQTRKRFLDALTVAATEPGTPLRVVLTIRADFYDRPLRHPRFATLLKQHTIIVTPLAPDELEHAITTPSTRAGVTYEPGLVAEIIADVNHQPGALPLLQYALTQSFDQTDNDTITIDTYRRIGGLTGALAQQAEQLWQNAPNDEQHATRRLFGHLVTLGEGAHDTRRRIHLNELAHDPATQSTINTWGNARLLTFDRDPHTRQPTIEIAHEALITEWPRLSEWLDNDQDDIRIHRHLTTTATAWNSRQRDPSELYRGGRLETAERWSDHHNTSLNPLEQEFLDASHDQYNTETNAENQRVRRLRILATTTAIIAAIAITASAVAFQQRTRADDNAAAAQSQADLALQREAEALDAQGLATQTAFEAETGRLVATAQSLASTNPRAALLVAVAANERQLSPETLGALQTALTQAGPLLGYLGWGTTYINVEWLANGLVVGVRSDGLDLFDPESGAKLDSVELGIGSPLTARYRTTAASTVPRLAAISGANTAIMFDVDEAFQERSRVTAESPIFALGYSPDGTALATTDLENRLTLWDDRGTARFTDDLDDNENIFEQVRSELGDDVLFKNFMVERPVVSSIHPNPEAVLVGVGSYLHRYDWNGTQLGEPSLTTFEYTPDVFSAGIAEVLFSEGAEPTLFLSGSGAWVAEESTEDSGLAPVLQPIPGLLGGGTPDIVAGLAKTGTTALVLLSDGTIARVDAATGSVERVVDLSISESSGAAIDPNNPGRAAIASPSGVVTVSLDGAGPLVSAVPRHPAAANTSISRNGHFAITGGAGALAPTTVWSNNGSRWTRDETLPPDPDLAAAAPPYYNQLLEVAGFPDDVPQRIYSLTGDQPTLAAEIIWSDIGSTAGGDNPDGSAVAYGGRDIRIHDFPSGDLMLRLPAPPGGTETDLISGVRYHPTGASLLVSTAAGRSQLWDTTEWEPIDLPQLDTDDIAIGYWNDDGTLLATASSAGVISIRDGETFAIIRNMVGAVGTSSSWNGGGLLFSNGNSLLLTNFDGPGRLWDVATGQQIGIEFETIADTNSGVNYGDPLQLITATEDHALIWNLDTGQWADLACRTAGSNLTRNEWTQWGPRDEPYRSVCPEQAG